MNRMRGGFLVVAVAAMLAGATAASAHSTTDITRAVLDTDTNIVTVHGTIVCDAAQAGQKFQINIRSIVQKSTGFTTRGGGTTGICTTTPTAFQVRSGKGRAEGTPQCGDLVRVNLRVRLYSPGPVNEETTPSETVPLECV